MAQLSTDEIQKVAQLARLTVSDEEVERLKQQLAEILQYIHRLDEVDTSSVEPMAHALEMTNVLRSDVAEESLPREQALANAPQTDGRYFLVPPILEDH